jgi:cyclopropane fatty-acyl-phospholipid synthase-like methyltransferase
MGRLKDGADVLDICRGAGVPVSRALSRRFSVTGVDVSGEMVRLAAANVPAGSFIHGDIMSVQLPPSRFDAAVASYSIFHLPLHEHPGLFRRIHGWPRPGGHLLATLSLSAEDPYIEDDFFGVPMYWSNQGLDDYRRILADVGFTVLCVGVVGHGYSETHAGPIERRPVVLARRSEARAGDGVGRA